MNRYLLFFLLSPFILIASSEDLQALREIKFCALKSLSEAQREESAYREAAMRLENAGSYIEIAALLRSTIDRVDREGARRIAQGWQEISDRFLLLYSTSANQFGNLQALYQRAHLYFDREEYHASIEDAENYLSRGGSPTAIEKVLEAARFETMQYEKVDSSFARFEQGKFTEALQGVDLTVECASNYSKEYEEGLVEGIERGLMQCSLSRWNSLYALDRVIWLAFYRDLSCWPLFVEACAQAFEKEGSDFAAGQRVGEVIGSRGTLCKAEDFFTILSFAKIKKASRLCILEALTLHPQAITEKALEHNQERIDYFAGVDIDWKEQKKYLTTDRFSHRITVRDLVALLQSVAGRGQRVLRADVCYCEKVTFAEKIGIFYGATGPLWTDRGYICYTPSGAYIEPAQP